MNYYEILGLSRNSEAEVIEAAYRALMKKYHPDRWSGNSSQAELRAKLINEAYATLRDPRRRCVYDKKNLRGAPREAQRAKKQAPPTAKRRPQFELPGWRLFVRKNEQQYNFRHANGDAGNPRKNPRNNNGSTERRPAANAPFLNRSWRVTAVIVCLGLTAFAGLTSRSTFQSQSTKTIKLALPPARVALLEGGREQTFCITNKTFSPVGYTLYWGDTNGREYSLRPGYYMIHTSGRSAAPMIEFFDHTMSAPARNILKTGMSRAAEPSCNPNYSFEYEDADLSRWSEYDRFGLYRDVTGKISSPPESPGAKPKPAPHMSLGVEEPNGLTSKNGSKVADVANG